MKKQERIAIYNCHGGYLPDGCPEELGASDFESRKALADWLLQNCGEYITEEHDDITVFEYKSHAPWSMGSTCMAVIPVDVCRPWLLHTC